jgi:hypothetical protein
LMATITVTPHLTQRIAARRWNGGRVLCSSHKIGPYGAKPADYRGPEGCGACRRATERMRAIREWLRKRGEL